MQVVLNSIHEWTTSNHMLINSKKTKDMLLTFRKSPTTPDSLHLGNCELERVNVFKLSGVWFQDNLRWNHSRFQGFKVLFAMITYNVSDLIKKIQKIVKKARKPIKKL